MRQSHLEFWLALAAIGAITLIYLFGMNALQAVPAAGGFFGHGLGIAGFLLMLMTETLYTLRKRTRRAAWGKMSSWLKFHIFTGLVGPYMALLHTSWKFNGLAGLVTLLTVMIVISGFIGRYIYTAVPRTAEGAEIERGELERQILAIQAVLDRPALAFSSAASTGEPLSPAALRGKSQPASAADLKTLTAQKERLERQIEALGTTRRLLSLWHTIHIPIGMALFAAAFIHIGAALYYATFLH